MSSPSGGGCRDIVRGRFFAPPHIRSSELRAGVPLAEVDRASVGLARRAPRHPGGSAARGCRSPTAGAHGDRGGEVEAEGHERASAVQHGLLRLGDQQLAGVQLSPPELRSYTPGDVEVEDDDPQRLAALRAGAGRDRRDVFGDDFSAPVALGSAPGFSVSSMAGHASGASPARCARSFARDATHLPPTLRAGTLAAREQVVGRPGRPVDFGGDRLDLPEEIGCAADV